MNLRSMAAAALLSVVAVVGSAGIATAGPPRSTLAGAAQSVEFEVVHGPNYGYYKAKYPTQLNWSHDGCSVPKAILDYPGVGAVIGHYSKLFNDSCNRHDFGYRNFGSAKNSPMLAFDPTRAYKDAIDRRFQSNMKVECSQHYNHWWDAPGKAACDGAADVFYEAVHYKGDGAFFG